MSVAPFLLELHRRDIHVWADGEQLRCDARAGALTPELREELRQRKSEILSFLRLTDSLARQQRAIVPLRLHGNRVPVYAVGGHNGDVFCYRALAQHLGEDQPFFGLQPPGLDGQGEPLTRVEDLAEYFAAQIRAFQPHGACHLAGYCAGGTIAFELGRQLLQSGREVGFIALFGSPYPSYYRLMTQFSDRLANQMQRLRAHARELASLPWRERRWFLTEKLRQRTARREAERAPQPDPMLELRRKVENATTLAVRRYTPAPFAGRICLLMPSEEWRTFSRVAALHWRSLAQHSEEHYRAGRLHRRQHAARTECPHLCRTHCRCRDKSRFELRAHALSAAG
jgi:thioesterase domain-containing protein